MSSTALVMMIVAMLVVWGGLIAAILFLRSRPEALDCPYDDPDMIAEDDARLSQPHPTRDT